MWCPHCSENFETDEQVCPRCGGPLSPALDGKQAKAQWSLSLGGRSRPIDNWPLDANGEPEGAAFLVHKSCVDMEDKLFINMLTAYGIPALMVHPLDGCFGKIVLGVSGDGSDIYVPLSELDNAKELMEDIDND